MLWRISLFYHRWFKRLPNPADYHVTDFPMMKALLAVPLSYELFPSFHPRTYAFHVVYWGMFAAWVFSDWPPAIAAVYGLLAILIINAAIATISLRRWVAFIRLLGNDVLLEQLHAIAHLEGPPSRREVDAALAAQGAWNKIQQDMERYALRKAKRDVFLAKAKLRIVKILWPF